jgi:hypothetical protein
VSIFEERPSNSPHIQFIWRATVTKSGNFIDVAHDFWVLVFRTRPARTEVILTGPVIQPETIAYQAGQTNWGIVFKAHVFITSLSKKAMLNNRTTLSVTPRHTFLLGKHEIAIPAYEEAEAFVEDLVKRGVLSASPTVARALSGKPPAMSVRHLQRQYAAVAGLTKGQVEQIQRARHAFVLLEQGKSIAAAASEAGYADQAHLTRSLRLLAGQTPGRIIQDYIAE